MKSKRAIMIYLVVFISGSLFLGCAGSQKAVQPPGPADHPARLTESGEKLLEKGDIKGAQSLFERALSQDEDFAPAIMGMARVNSVLGKSDEAFSLCEKAVDKAGSKEERLQAQTLLMAFHLKHKNDDWLEDVEDLWEDIREDHEKPEHATLLMGDAYYADKQYLKASTCWRQVLDWGGGKVAEADKSLEKLYKELRAAPGTVGGTQIAAMDAVNRGDLAVLLIQDLKLPEYLESKKPLKYSARFESPEEAAKQEEDTSLPDDVTGHPYALPISEALAYGIRGLEVFPDGLFHPDRPVNRANFALVLEDLLVRIKDEPLLKRAFLGNESPFPDVANDHYAFNAMIVCTTRNLLAANLDGAFCPDEPVTGAESLLALRRLKEEIKGRQVKY